MVLDGYHIYLPQIFGGGMTKTLGIDVSKWQNSVSTPQTMDFTKAAASGAKFVFIKASQQLYADPDIVINWQNAKAAGLLRGAYHFLTWDKPGRDQARYHWSLIQSDPGELPPVCDFESWGTIPTNAYSILWEYLNELKMLCGRTPIIYTGYYFWLTYGNKAGLDWAQFPLWLAYYAAEAYVKVPAPWSKWTFWQYTSKGDGVAFGAESLNLDMDWFNGTYDELIAFAGVTPPEPPVVDPHIAQLEAAYNELLDIQAGITAAKDAFAADLVTATNKFADELARQNGEIEYVKSILKGS